MLTNVQNALTTKKRPFRPTADQQPNCFRLIFSRKKFGRVGSFLRLFSTFQNSRKELQTRPNFFRIFASSSELPDLLRKSSDYQNSEEIRKKFVNVKPGHNRPSEGHSHKILVFKTAERVLQICNCFGGCKLK